MLQSASYAVYGPNLTLCTRNSLGATQRRAMASCCSSGRQVTKSECIKKVKNLIHPPAHPCLVLSVKDCLWLRGIAEKTESTSFSVGGLDQVGFIDGNAIILKSVICGFCLAC
ncbi:hypothetical protein SDJN03_08158, partial [Cucurbita argyrosperma subsp. sororia]